MTGLLSGGRLGCMLNEEAAENPEGLLPIG
jgi:hypothetical protein